MRAIARITGAFVAYQLLGGAERHDGIDRTTGTPGGLPRGARRETLSRG
jgi:hypothetical protein